MRSLKQLLTAISRAKSPWRDFPWFPIASMNSYALGGLDRDLILCLYISASSERGVGGLSDAH